MNFELEIFQLHTTPGLDLHTDHTQGWLRLVEEEKKISVGGCASVFQINIPNTYIRYFKNKIPIRISSFIDTFQFQALRYVEEVYVYVNTHLNLDMYTCRLSAAICYIPTIYKLFKHVTEKVRMVVKARID